MYNSFWERVDTSMGTLKFEKICIFTSIYKGNIFQLHESSSLIDEGHSMEQWFFDIMES